MSDRLIQPESEELVAWNCVFYTLLLSTSYIGKVSLTEVQELRAYECTAVSAAASCRKDPLYGARAIPLSVMIAATYFAGVTSNAGFSTSTPSGTICFPAMWV